MFVKPRAVSGAAAERAAAYKWPGLEPPPPAAYTRDGDHRGHPDRAAPAVRLHLQVTSVEDRYYQVDGR